MAANLLSATRRQFRRIARICLILIALAAALPASAAAPYEVAVQKDVMVPMRDGVHLATDLSLPIRDGQPLSRKLPTILERRPYNKDGCGGAGRYYASHG